VESQERNEKSAFQPYLAPYPLYPVMTAKTGYAASDPANTGKPGNALIA
jgi:hypothetical protein